MKFAYIFFLLTFIFQVHFLAHNTVRFMQYSTCLNILIFLTEYYFFVSYSDTVIIWTVSNISVRLLFQKRLQKELKCRKYCVAWAITLVTSWFTHFKKWTLLSYNGPRWKLLSPHFSFKLYYIGPLLGPIYWSLINSSFKRIYLRLQSV